MPATSIVTPNVVFGGLIGAIIWNLITWFYGIPSSSSHALIGGLIGAAVFYIAPPPYRAHAVALVDFNLEQAWPQNTDREQFYYLERETRKLEEIAYSDSVLKEIVNAEQNINVQELRNSGMLLLSQPGNGGWNFYVDDTDPGRAAAIATTWAIAFKNQVQLQVAASDGLNSFITVDVTRIATNPVTRSISMSLYIFVGAVAVLMLGSILVLFFAKPQ